MIFALIIAALYLWGGCIAYTLWREVCSEDGLTASIVAAALWPAWPLVAVITVICARVSSLYIVWRR